MTTVHTFNQQSPIENHQSLGYAGTQLDQKIVVASRETIWLMAVIDQTIAFHGGLYFFLG